MQKTTCRMVLAATLATLAIVPLLGQGSPSQRPENPRRAGAFRHYPGGKAVPGLEAGARPAAGPLVAEANRDLARGIRVQAAKRPVVSQAGINQLYRFALEYDGVALAADADYVAVLHPSGRLLATRARNLPDTVDETRPAIDAATVAVEHARPTFAVTGTATVASPRLEIWVDAQARGRLTWAFLVRAIAGELPRSFAYRIAAIGTAEVLEAYEARFQGTVHAQANVWQGSPLLPAGAAPLPDLTLTSNIVTDINGNATVPAGLQWAGTILVHECQALVWTFRRRRSSPSTRRPSSCALRPAPQSRWHSRCASSREPRAGHAESRARQRTTSETISRSNRWDR